MSFRAVDVAQYILEYNKFEVTFTRKPINYVKLQALLYFVQYRWFQKTGTVCFDDAICVDTNINAPYIDEIWRVFSKYGNAVIQVIGNKIDYSSTPLWKLSDTVRSVLYECSKLDGSELFAIIRRTDAFNKCQVIENGRTVISMDMLKLFLANTE